MCYHSLITHFKERVIHMMLVPRRDSFDLFDDFFRDDFLPREKNKMMSTDIKETKDAYVIEMDLPGFTKDSINLSLKNGYLEIHAKQEKEDNEEKEKYVRRERFYGECSRSFYIGDNVKEDEIDAEFKNGILMINVPKKEDEENESNTKQIEIK